MRPLAVEKMPFGGGPPVGSEVAVEWTRRVCVSRFLRLRARFISLVMAALATLLGGETGSCGGSNAGGAVDMTAAEAS